ncbi:hypothetical protein [Clavibacter michiganensis]|uniref:hypothetical protein n=1 Tax=Clavibacter michiganensis TaxID=28447 RepID=UPI00292F38DC|nr:hypothetical protein [Clavibacter michiganensis]
MPSQSREIRYPGREWVLVVLGAVVLVIAVVRAFTGAGLEVWMFVIPLLWISAIPDLVIARWQRQRDAERNGDTATRRHGDTAECP